MWSEGAGLAAKCYMHTACNYYQVWQTQTYKSITFRQHSLTSHPSIRCPLTVTTTPWPIGVQPQEQHTLHHGQQSTGMRSPCAVLTILTHIPCSTESAYFTHHLCYFKSTESEWEWTTCTQQQSALQTCHTNVMRDDYIHKWIHTRDGKKHWSNSPTVCARTRKLIKVLKLMHAEQTCYPILSSESS